MKANKKIGVSKTQSPRGGRLCGEVKVENKTEENRAINRRVEMRVVSN